MSEKRQKRGRFEPIGDRRSHIVTLTQDYHSGHEVRLHFHDRDQLVYASRGVMTVRTAQGIWVVPVDRAVWIPERVAHTITMSGAVAMRTLYLRPGLAATLPRGCCVVHVPPLLRELILHACARGLLRGNVARERHLIEVILDQLRAAQTAPLQLPAVTDARAKRVAEALLGDPADRRPLGQICRKSGASGRTVERIFVAETGMTLGKWRQQLRLLAAMRLLGEGAKVTYAALEAGYSTPSSFIAAFRKALGATPTEYFRRGSEGAGTR